MMWAKSSWKTMESSIKKVIIRNKLTTVTLRLCSSVIILTSKTYYMNLTSFLSTTTLWVFCPKFSDSQYIKILNRIVITKVWYFMLPTCLKTKLLLHTWQVKGLFFLCFSWWASRYCLVKKVLSHCPHTYFGTSTCIFSCRLSKDSLENDLLQIIQSYGLSPIWVCKCFCRSYLVKNFLEHSIHSKLLSRSWFGRCKSSNCFKGKVLSQCGQGKQSVFTWLTFVMGFTELSSSSKLE